MTYHGRKVISMEDIKKQRQEQVDRFEREHPMLTDKEREKASNNKYVERHVRLMFENYLRWKRAN